MSPEQALGQTVDARTDLWSLGALYYESLAGTAAVPGQQQHDRSRTITSQPATPLQAVRADVPALAEHIVTRALEKKPELRYQRAADIETDLRRMMRDLSPQWAASGAASGVTTGVAGPGAVRRPHRWRVGIVAGSPGCGGWIDWRSLVLPARRETSSRRARGILADAHRAAHQSVRRGVVADIFAGR